MTVNWHCQTCLGELHLAGTLWRTADGAAHCPSSSPSLIDEQYDAADVKGVARSSGGGHVHIPASDWIHPSLREVAT